MKKVILYAVCVLMVSSAIAAAPGTKLIQSFNQTFPNAQNVKWRDDKDGFFVSFSQNGNFNKVFYNTDGSFIYSLKYYTGNALPTNIVMALNKKFGESKIAGVTEVTTPNNTVYNIKLTKDDKLYSVNILADGSITEQEEFTDGTVDK